MFGENPHDQRALNIIVPLGITMAMVGALLIATLEWNNLRAPQVARVVGAAIERALDMVESGVVRPVAGAFGPGGAMAPVGRWWRNELPPREGPYVERVPIVERLATMLARLVASGRIRPEALEAVRRPEMLEWSAAEAVRDLGSAESISDESSLPDLESVLSWGESMLAYTASETNPSEGDDTLDWSFEESEA